MASKSVSEDSCLRRSGEIKNSLKTIDEKLDKLLSNHIPHLDTKLALLEERISLSFKKEPKTAADKINDNKGWIGVAIVMLIQIIMFLLGIK